MPVDITKYIVAISLMSFLAVLIVLAVFMIKLYAGRNQDLRKQALFAFLIFLGITIVWATIDFFVPKFVFHIYKLILQMLSTITLLVFAFLVNQLINHYIWLLIFTGKDGKCLIPTFLTRAVSVFVYAIFIALIVRFVFGRSEAVIIAFSGGAAFILGYAAQQVIAEVFAGVALNVAPVFRRGDYVKLADADEFYIVEDMNWRFATFISETNNKVYVPNTSLTSMKIRNCQHQSLVVIVSFSTLFSAHPQKVIELIEETVSQIPELDNTRAISVNIDAFSKSALYSVEVPIKRASDYYLARTNTYKLIWKVLKDEGIDLYTPNLNLYMPKAKVPKKLGIEDEKKLFDIFSAVPIFKDFKKEDIKKLIKGARVQEFIHPQRVITYGATDNSLYVIAKGEVSIRIPQRKGEDDLIIRTLGEGKSAGIMALMTGEPRTAHVVAEKTTITYEIRKADLKPILDKNPKYINKIAERIDEMLAENEAKEKKRKISLQKEKEMRSKRQKTLVGRIREFFEID